MNRDAIMFGFTRIVTKIRRFPREWCYTCRVDHALDRRVAQAMKRVEDRRLYGLGDNRSRQWASERN